MTTATVIAFVALAVAALVLHPAIIAVVGEMRERRKAKEREALEKELKDACNSGNSARVIAVRLRLRQLDD